MLLPLLFVACHSRVPVTPAPEAPKPWVEFPSPVLDLGCTESKCVVLTASGLHTFSARLPSATSPQPAPPGTTALVSRPSNVLAVRPCHDVGLCIDDPVSPDPLPLPEPLNPPDPTDFEASARFFADHFSPAAKNRGRVGFYSLVVAPDGGRIAILPGAGSTLMRSGTGLRAFRLGVEDRPAPWPASLALHPSGNELYVIAWPNGTLRSLNPLTFEPNWALGLEGPAHGLYLDSSARYLIAQTEGDSEAGLGSHMRIEPFPAADGEVRDEVLRTRDAPYADITVVVDLSERAVAAVLPGRLVRTVNLSDGLVVATAQAVQFVPSAPVRSPP